MRKFFAVFVLSFIVSSTAILAQSSPLPGGNPNFKAKDFYVGAHLGLGGGWYSTIGPVVNIEYGVLSNLGITASTGFFGYTEGFTGYTWSYTSIPVIVGANYHFDLLRVNKLDTWIGIGLGYTFGGWSSSDASRAYTGSVGSYFSWDGRLGGRYYFSDKLAAKLEFGYWSLGYARIGVDFKL
jgi:hypothetical protein